MHAKVLSSPLSHSFPLCVLHTKLIYLNLRCSSILVNLLPVLKNIL
jgi:hypothetical protein